MGINKNETFKELEAQMKMIKPFVWGAKAAKFFGVKSPIIQKLIDEAPASNSKYL